MTYRRIFCEEPDDLSALRELLTRGFGLTLDRTTKPAGRGERFAGASGALILDVTVAGSDERVLEEAVDMVLRNGSPSNPPTMLGLSFDPDTDDSAQWEHWIEGAIRE